MPEHGYAKKQKTTTLILIEARRKQASTLTTAKDKPNKVGKGAAWSQSSSKRRSQRLHHRCLHQIALQSDKVSACNQKRHCSPTKCLHATKRDLHKTCDDQMNGLLYNTCDRGTESRILQSCTWKQCAKKDMGNYPDAATCLEPLDLLEHDDFRLQWANASSTRLTFTAMIREHNTRWTSERPCGQHYTSTEIEAAKTHFAASPPKLIGNASLDRLCYDIQITRIAGGRWAFATGCNVAASRCVSETRDKRRFQKLDQSNCTDKQNLHLDRSRLVA